MSMNLGMPPDGKADSFQAFREGLDSFFPNDSKSAADAKIDFVALGRFLRTNSRYLTSSNQFDYKQITQLRQLLDFKETPLSLKQRVLNLLSRCFTHPIKDEMPLEQVRAVVEHYRPDYSLAKLDRAGSNSPLIKKIIQRLSQEALGRFAQTSRKAGALARVEQVRRINAQPEKALDQQGFRTLEQVVDFARKNGDALSCLNLRGRSMFGSSAHRATGFVWPDPYDSDTKELFKLCPNITHLSLTWVPAPYVIDALECYDGKPLTELNIAFCPGFTYEDIPLLEKFPLTRFEFNHFDRMPPRVRDRLHLAVFCHILVDREQLMTRQEAEKIPLTHLKALLEKNGLQALKDKLFTLEELASMPLDQLHALLKPSHWKAA